jgi:hypothetical protein
MVGSNLGVAIVEAGKQFWNAEEKESPMLEAASKQRKRRNYCVHWCVCNDEV